MVELDISEYQTVLPLVRKSQIPGYSSYAFSVLEGRQKGRVFVDNRGQPRSALIINFATPALVCGAADKGDLSVFLQEILAHSLEGQVLTFWTTSEEWHTGLSALPAFPRHRTVFTYPSSTPKTEEEYALPNGFRLEQIDEVLAQRLQDGLDPWGIDVWEGPPGFVQGSVGYCVVQGDQIVSACTAAFIGDGAAEVSIVTDERFRRQGLAATACRALIRHCLAHNLRPNWSCNSNNFASVALAEKLGFVRQQEIKGYLLSSSSWT